MRTILCIAIVAAGITIYGWAANIATVVENFDDPLTTEQVVRIVGIPFYPLGVVLGYID